MHDDPNRVPPAPGQTVGDVAPLMLGLPVVETALVPPTISFIWPEDYPLTEYTFRMPSRPLFALSHFAPDDLVLSARMGTTMWSYEGTEVDAVIEHLREVVADYDAIQQRRLQAELDAEQEELRQSRLAEAARAARVLEVHPVATHDPVEACPCFACRWSRTEGRA
jgi:hypothetical protein